MIKRILILAALCLGLGFITKAYADYNVPTLCEAAEELHKQPVNLDALAYAVAVAESGNCTSEMAKAKHNCHSIRRHGEYVSYSSFAESFASFKRMWSNSRYYAGSFPTCFEAETYLGHTRIRNWMLNVYVSYFRFQTSS